MYVPELHSWKEIAEYLDVSVRTAQLWEKDRGLPVRRLPGGRGRVLVGTEEIETWKRSAQPPPPAPEPPPRPWIRWAIAALAVALVAVATAAAFRIRTPRLATVQLDGEMFVALDDRGEVAWRHAAPGINSTEYNRPSSARLMWVVDLDGDGENEAIIGIRTYYAVLDGVLCLDAKGRELWRFHPGRPVMLEGRRLDPPFIPVDLRISPPDARGRRAVVVSSQHHMYSPTQIAVLDAAGRVQGEYFHRGHLARLGLREENGRWLIYAAGTSNGDARATVVLLDPARLRREPDLVAELPSRTAVARLLLGKTCINKATSLFNEAKRIVVEPTGITLSTNEVPNWRGPDTPAITWRADAQLRPLWVGAEDSYIVWLREHPEKVPAKCRGEDVAKLIEQAVLTR